MADPGDNGDGAPQEVEVQEVPQSAVLPTDRALLEKVVARLLERVLLLVGNTSEEAQDELKLVGILLGKLGNFVFPKLASIHQVNDDMDKWMARMEKEMTVDEAKRALSNLRRRRTDLSARAGRPALQEQGEADGE